jgi:Pectate lyase superfamily protein
MTMVPVPPSILALAPLLALFVSMHSGGSAVSVKTFGARGDGLTDDTAAFERAFRTKKVETLILPDGKYKVSRPLRVLKDGVKIDGQGVATLLSVSGNFAIESAANNVTITGITFQGAGFHGTGQLQSGMTLSRNKFQNTSGKDAILFDGILTRSRIEDNSFYHIAPKNFLSVTYPSLGFPQCWTTTCDSPGSGIVVFGGLDQTSITNNTFDIIASDAMHIGWNHIAAPSMYFLTKDNDISYNKMSRVHRIGLELQGIWSWPRCGHNGQEQCDASRDFSTNTRVKGNYFHDPLLAYTNTYGYSLALWGDGQYINNAAIENEPKNCMGHVGFGIENMGNNVLTQGNVIASEYLSSCGPQHGWYPIIYGAQRKGAVFTTQNNVICGDQASTKDLGTEPSSNGTKVNQYNHISDSCENVGRLDQSAIALAFTTTSHSQSSERCGVAVTSALPIRDVQWFMDSSKQAAVTQELADVNTSFSQDKKWLYNAVLSTADLAAGEHAVTVRATDVSGAMKEIKKTFVVAPPRRTT